MTDTTLADARAAHQLELILSGLICQTKQQIQGYLDQHDIDAMRDTLADLMALEACRRHALAADPDPLDEQTINGYRILNNYLEVRQ